MSLFCFILEFALKYPNASGTHALLSLSFSVCNFSRNIDIMLIYAQPTNTFDKI